MFWAFEVYSFILCDSELSSHKKEDQRELSSRRSSCCDYHWLLRIISHGFAARKYRRAFSHIFPEIIHARPEISGQFRPAFWAAFRMFSRISQGGLRYFHSFLVISWKRLSISLCSLRIDKTAFAGYNKARNQTSTAEDQKRSNPSWL